MLMLMFSAIIYYLLLITYTYIYNILCEILYIIDNAFSKNLYDKIRYFYGCSYLSILKLLRIKIIYIDESLPPAQHQERVLWISNHRSKLDGLLVQSILCTRYLDTIAVTKYAIKLFPIFGSFGNHVNAIYVSPSDTEILSRAASYSIEKNKSILIFPEGTTFSPQSKLSSDKFAEKFNLSKLSNVLIPRTLGFDILRSKGNFNSIGNITIQYSHPEIPFQSRHSFLDLFRIFPRKIYIRTQIIKSDVDLMKVFEEKDLLLNTLPNISDSSTPEPTIHIYLNILMLGIFLYLIFFMKNFFLLTIIISIISTVTLILGRNFDKKN